MKTTTNHQRTTEQKTDALPWAPRQGELDLAGADRWQRFSAADRDACRQALAQLLYQVITNQPKNNENER